MPVQTSYSKNIAIAYAGGIYGLSPREIVSRSVETPAGIAFGVVVSRGTDADNQCVLGGANNILGVTVRDLAREGNNAGDVLYSEKESAAIMREGTVWAVCPSGCVPGNAVNFVEATGVLDAGTPVGVGETGLDNCYWDSTAAAGELAVLRIRDVNQITAGV